MLAGIFDSWTSEDGTVIKSYSVVTMDSSPAFAHIHERMPAVLETEEDVDSWLDFELIPARTALDKLKPSLTLALHPVSTDVGNVKNQQRSLTLPIDLNKPKPLSASGKLMANWLGKKSSPVASTTPTSEVNQPGKTEAESVKRKLVPSEESSDPPSKLKKESD